MSSASARNGGEQMMIAEEYMSRSRLFQRLKNAPHGQLIERYAANLCRT